MSLLLGKARRGFGLRWARGWVLAYLVTHHRCAVEALVVDRLEVPLEHGDHLLVGLGTGDQMKYLAVVVLFDFPLYSLDVLGRTGLHPISGVQIVVEPVVGVAADDEGTTVLVGCHVGDGLADLFFSRGRVVVHREEQVGKGRGAQPDGHDPLEDPRRPARERAGYGACHQEVDRGKRNQEVLVGEYPGRALRDRVRNDERSRSPCREQQTGRDTRALAAGSQIIPAAQEKEAKQRPRPEREYVRAAEEKLEKVGHGL